MSSVALARLKKNAPALLVPCEGCRHERFVHVTAADGRPYCWTGEGESWCDCTGFVDPPHLRDTPDP